ncbi:C-X-C motif chemokine 9 [Ctenodactylus gundi]
MKPHVVPFFIGVSFLVLFEAQGTPGIRNRRCSCINTWTPTIHPKSLKDLKQFAPSPSCDKTEIIATMKNGDQRCLNPNSPGVRKLVEEWEMQISRKKKQKKEKKHQKIKKVVKVKKSQPSRRKKRT